MNTLLFDIKTGPLPEPDLEKIKPRFNAPANFRDEGKIAAAVLEKETAWKEQAALSALSGRVLAIGCLEPGKPIQVLDSLDESEILRDFWRLCREQILAEDGRAIGFNIHGFDLPFLLRRSWRQGVPIPADLRQGRYWNHRFIDLLDLWMLQDRERVSLARLCAYFNLGEKLGDGADFARPWQNDRPQALAWLERDVELIHRLAAAMGVLPAGAQPERSLIDQLLAPPPALAAPAPSLPSPRKGRRERSRFQFGAIAPLSHITE
jgi:hypothetical protein